MMDCLRSRSARFFLRKNSNFNFSNALFCTFSPPHLFVFFRPWIASKCSLDSFFFCFSYFCFQSHFFYFNHFSPANLEFRVCVMLFGISKFNTFSVFGFFRLNHRWIHSIKMKQNKENSIFSFAFWLGLLMFQHLQIEFCLHAPHFQHLTVKYGPNQCRWNSNVIDMFEC